MPRRKVVHKNDALRGTPYLVYNPHQQLNLAQQSTPSLSKEELNPFTQKLDRYLQIVSIDPGIKNCGFFIGRIWCSGHHECKFLSRINFCDPKYADGLASETSYFNNVFVKLDKLASFFENTHYIVIEKQMTVNVKLIKFTHYLICYFMRSLSGKGYLPLIFEIDSHLKTKTLGAPSFRKKPQRKEWCRNFVLTMLKKSDTSLFEFISKLGKNDDVSDAICQEMAFSIVSGIINPFEKSSSKSKIPTEFYFLLSTLPSSQNIYGTVLRSTSGVVSQSTSGVVSQSSSPKIGKRTSLPNSSLNNAVKISSIPVSGSLLPSISLTLAKEGMRSEEKNKKNSS